MHVYTHVLHICVCWLLHLMVRTCVFAFCETWRCPSSSINNTFVSFESAGGGFSWFQRNASRVAGEQWEFKQRLDSTDVVSSFGYLCVGHGGMVFDGSKLVCGGSGGSGGLVWGSGRGYVFAFNQTSNQWAVEGILQPDTDIISSGAGCGFSMAISGDKIVMGCPGQNNNLGTAFMFVRDNAVSLNGGWGNGTELLPNSYPAGVVYYGQSVGIDGKSTL